MSSPSTTSGESNDSPTGAWAWLVKCSHVRSKSARRSSPCDLAPSSGRTRCAPVVEHVVVVCSELGLPCERLVEPEITGYRRGPPLVGDRDTTEAELPRL